MKIPKTCILLFIVSSTISSAQSLQPKLDKLSDNTGMFSLGARNTISVFNSHDGTSFGVGGHFRIQLSDRVNTEWYADFMSSNLENQLARRDYHIGWSVLYYLLPSAKSNFFQPFIEAGHCFDFTQLSNSSTSVERKRWSSAVQMGAGFHINITDRFDITLKTQYMLHLGGHIHADKNPFGIYEIHEHEGFQAEGHLLNTLSINYKIGRLWKR